MELTGHSRIQQIWDRACRDAQYIMAEIAVALGRESVICIDEIKRTSEQEVFVNFSDAASVPVDTEALSTVSSHQAANDLYYLLNGFEKQHAQIDAFAATAAMAFTDLGMSVPKEVEELYAIVSFKQDKLSRADCLLADLTIAQAMCRQLKPGETRAQLAQRCAAGLNKHTGKLLVPSPKFAALLKDATGQ
jgi:hypothetical protein